MKYPFKTAEFITSAAKLSQCPDLKDKRGDALPEIAFLGRSNVGKSTLLNHLLNRKSLAKVSATPGKTQLLNYFNIDDALALVDLPGYGYAKVPKSMQRDWGKILGTYVEKREPLCVMLLLVDMRRDPSEADLRCLEWAMYHEKSVIVVLTKADKIKKAQRKARADQIIKAFGVENLQTVHYSATKNIGRDQLIRMINEAVAEELEEDDNGPDE